MIIVEEKMKRREHLGYIDDISTVAVLTMTYIYLIDIIIVMEADISITSTCDNTCTLYQQNDKWASILNKKIRRKFQ